MNPSEDFKMKKDTKILQELLSKISSYLDPDTTDDKMKGLYDQKLSERLFGEKPECFVAIKGKGQDISTLLPVCNRAGIQDPRVIQFSIKLAQRMTTSDKVGLVDPASLTEAISTLQDMSKKYEIVEERVNKKAISKIKDYLKSTRG